MWRRARQSSRYEADRVDDEHVVLPLADRVPIGARRDVRGMRRDHVHGSRAAVPAVLDLDRTRGLRNAVDGLAAPIGNDAAGGARALGARHLWRRSHRRLTSVGQLHGGTSAEAATAAARRCRARRLRLRRAARARNLLLTLGHATALELPDLAQ